MSKRVLITGATGALGRVLVRRLRAEPERYTLHAPPRSGAPQALDLRDSGGLIAALERVRPHLILHLAATYRPDAQEAQALHVEAAATMLAWARRCPDPVRLLLVGSAAEYGLVAPHDNPIRETQPLRPVSLYGLSKARQSWLAEFHARQGVDVVVARPFNLIGPHLSERLFVGRLQRQIRELQRGERSHLELGSLTAVRDYLPLDEAVSQLLAIAEHGRSGGCYHVASGVPVRMRDLLQQQLERLHLDASIVIERADLSPRRGPDVPVIYADMRRTIALLQGLQRPESRSRLSPMAASAARRSESDG